MTDFHIHLLPCMDDGAQSVAESQVMLSLLAAQGVTSAVCTPHYFAEKEPAAQFLERRAQSYAQLCQSAQTSGVTLALGAEITMWQGMSGEITDQFCLGDSNLLLCELPVSYGAWVIDELEELSAQGYCPIIAHLDRVQALYTDSQLASVLECHGVAYQFNAASLCQARVRGLMRALYFVDARLVLGSDGHGAKYRSPDFKGAGKALAGFRMREVRERIEQCDREFHRAIF